MQKLEYQTAERIELKNHPQFNEAWLQDRIAENPSILGLGELELIDRERKQEKAGRLDLLLADFEKNSRYEVELQFGKTDESHIIRCIEYWDIEKRRYPAYDHCAVLIAEELTSRFLNVLGLFNGQIPLIILQLNALKIDGKIILNFTKVMDRFSLRNDDLSESKLVQTDREYWNKKATDKTVTFVEKFLEIINEKAEPQQKLNYNKHYIGLTDGFRSRNFIHFKPKKQFTHILLELEDPDSWREKLEDAGISAFVNGKWLQLTLNPSELSKNQELIRSIVLEAVMLYNG